MKPSPTTNTCIAIGLLSKATIAFQLVLMQVFSITQWYHFAYMVISIALMGYGASGTVLSIFKKRLMDNYNTLFPLLLFIAAIGMGCVTAVANTEAIRFDTYLLFNDYQHIGRLLITYLLFLLPFFFAALAIGMSFVKYSGQIGKIYFANLVGSGLGGILAIVLMWMSLPAKLPAIIAIIPYLSGFFCWQNKRVIKIMAGTTGAILIVMNILTPNLTPSQFKSISKTLLLPEAKITHQESSPFGLTQVVSSPVLRYAPGLSLNYRQPIPVRKALFNNGDWQGAIVPRPQTDSLTILSYTSGVVPYIIRRPRKVLILHSGTGENIAMALSYNVPLIDAVESNAATNRLLRDILLDDTDSLFRHPSVRLHQIEPRTFLSNTSTRYDLIQLPTIGSFYGTSGLNAFQVQFNLTLEAFQEMWAKLSAQGVISVSCWMDYPVRNPLKITATLSELLRSKGLIDIENHLVAIRSWSTITFMVKSEPFTPMEIRRIRNFCHDMSFDPLLLPNLMHEESELYNELGDPHFFTAIDTLTTSGPEKFIQDYPFRIKPATDNRPFFSQYIRVKHLPQLSSLFGNQAIPFFELGYVVVLLTFLQILICSILLIILPLIISRYKVTRKGWILLYFGGIGLGYMFLEMVFIQQFTLYLGHPIHSAAAVISFMLLTSGMGSYFSSRIKSTGKALFNIPITIALCFILYAFFLPVLLKSTIALPLLLKIVIMILITGVPGFIMGLPFPLGLTRLTYNRPDEVPWAWAINGYSSVISATLATIVSVETGFFWVMIIAAGAYGVAGVVNKTGR